MPTITRSTTTVKLSDLTIHQRAVITEILDEEIEILTLRLGLSVGQTLTCVARIPQGPVVVRSGAMELAIGRLMAEKIRVEPE